MGIKKFLPQTLLGRSILIVGVPVLILQIFMVYMFFDRHWTRMTDRLAFAVAGEIAAIIDVVEHDPNPGGDLVRVQGLAARHMDLLVTFQPAAMLKEQNQYLTPLKKMVVDTLVRALENQVKRPFTVRMIEDDKVVIVDVQVTSGVLSVTCLQRRLYSSSSYIFLLWMITTSVLLTLISLLFMRNQIRPLHRLAAAARRFGRGMDTDTLKPSGAREVRQATQAFIDMRDRIKRQIEGRTIMLAGVSHDLRTPLTRLKLGLALLPDGADTRALQEDITTMERMITAYLDFARGEGNEEPAVTDLSVLISRLVEDARRAGAVVESDIQDQVVLSVRPLGIERAIQNILQNAVKYGTRVRVAVRSTPDDVFVTMDDNGPGIPPDRYADVFKPFFRLDSARVADGGVGLGLSIALDIVMAHGGHIELNKSADLKGLQVVIQLPR